MSPNNRLGTLSVETLSSLVNARDVYILGLVRDHRFITTRQIQRLVFWQHATVEAGTRASVRVLARLFGHRLIYRLERHIGGTRAGSAAYVWRLDDAGDRLMRAHSGEANGKRIRELSPSRMFLAHTLAIAEVRVLLEEGARRADFDLLAVTTEPHTWRSFPAGYSSEILKPDLHTITASGAYEDHWFIELDRGTESLPTLIRKCLVYQAHWASGQEQAQLGVYPRVAWLIEDNHRRALLQTAIEAEGQLDPNLFIIDSVQGFIARCSAETT